MSVGFFISDTSVALEYDFHPITSKKSFRQNCAYTARISWSAHQRRRPFISGMVQNGLCSVSQNCMISDFARNILL